MEDKEIKRLLGNITSFADNNQLWNINRSNALNLVDGPNEGVYNKPQYTEDELKNISFYAPKAMIKVNGTVRHISKIDEGKYKDSYILGIESPEIIGEKGTSLNN